jgi:hypothetical protein
MLILLYTNQVLNIPLHDKKMSQQDNPAEALNRAPVELKHRSTRHDSDSEVHLACPVEPGPRWVFNRGETYLCPLFNWGAFHWD